MMRVYPGHPWAEWDRLSPTDQIIIPAATGTYGGGVYGGGSLPTGSGSCLDMVTGLPVPYSVVAQFPPTSAGSPATSFGLSTTTTLAEGANAVLMQLPAVSLYSVLVASNLSAVVDTDVLSLTRGLTLSAAMQTLVVDVSSSAILMMLGTFLTKLAPVFCISSFGGTASPATAGLMDLQVFRAQNWGQGTDVAGTIYTIAVGNL